MLKHNEVNPLAVFGLRRVEHCPPHFTTIKFSLRTNEKNITDWIWENLAGRFYLGDDYAQTDAGYISMDKLVGFEQAGEASYFSLVIDTINGHDVEW
jgi:hypothetical protein